MTRAVVFAYHEVGVRCLSVLLAHGVEVPLVVTHEDDPGENVWFGSVASLAALHGIDVIKPDDANAPDVVARVAALHPDFLFSFYYRRMLGRTLLDLAPRGALNMHGSLLPAFRGRAPVNWAIVKGARRTGATLHYMTEKPDQGAIVAQQAVPILPDDVAQDVFHKVTWAAEVALDGCLAQLLDGTAPAHPQDLAAGSYFTGRRPEDGRIDWTAPAQAVHDLVRAVAPPYPGAFSDLPEGRLRLLRTMVLPGPTTNGAAPSLFTEGALLCVRCADGRRLRVLAAELDGEPLDAAACARRFGGKPLALTGR